MKPVLFVLSLVLLAGCSSIPLEVASQMSASADQYGCVTKGMTKEEVLARLGPPQTEEGSRAIWEVRYDPKNFDSLELLFDGAGQVTGLTRKHSRQTKTPFRFERSYAYTK